MNRRMNSERPLRQSILVLLPLYDDWDALGLLLLDLDRQLADHGIEARILIVDDGSTVQPGVQLCSGPFLALAKIELLSLRRNLGHQRAIAIGLAYVEANIDTRTVVIMDSDGEDSPADVPKLLARFRQESANKIVFAERIKHSESATFVFFYSLYRWLHLVLTGVHVRVGNFSVIPRSRLESLVTVSELWNHYAAAVFKSRRPALHCADPACQTALGEVPNEFRGFGYTRTERPSRFSAKRSARGS